MGGHGQDQATGLLAHDWEFAADYRYFYAEQFYYGTQQSTPPPEFFGQPLYYRLHSLDLNLTYAASDRFSVRLSAPFSTGTQSRFYPDTVRHTSQASGLGDLNVVGSLWVFNPRSHAAGNLAIGAGVKLPTGNYRVRGSYYLPDGSSVTFPVDQSIEPGDGGWGIILQGQGYNLLSRGLYGYLTGSYLATPPDQTEVTRAPPGQRNANVHYSIADSYTARAGATYTVWPREGLSFSLGGRIDGIPYHDLLGNSDGFRRPGFIVFLDPAVSLDRGLNSLLVSVPVRVAQRLATRQASQSSGGAIGAGDLARAVIFLGFSHRFLTHHTPPPLAGPEGTEPHK